MRRARTISAYLTSWSDMTLIAALAGLALLQTSEPGQRPLMLAGKLVPITFPSTPADAGVPQDVVAWDGFKYLAGQERTLHAPNAAPPDWSWLKESYAAVADTRGAPWRMRIVLLVPAETMWKDERGLLRVRKGYLNTHDLGLVLQGIARLTALVAVKTGGKVRLVPDVTVDEAP